MVRLRSKICLVRNTGKRPCNAMLNHENFDELMPIMTIRRIPVRVLYFPVLLLTPARANPGIAVRHAGL